MTTDHQGAELKPCPFCGGSAEITERDVEPQGDPWYGKRLETFVVCGCGACLFDGGFHEGFYDPETRAIAAWNRRPAPAAGGDGLPELPEQVARVYWTLHDGPHVGWQSYKAMNAAILEGPQPEKPLYTADQMRQYARDAVAAKVPLTDDDVFSLVGHAEFLRMDGQEDMPAWLLEFACRVAQAIGDPELLSRTKSLAARPPSDSAPANDRQPLDDKQIMRGWLDWTEPGCSATDAFVAGVRFTEKHHGVAPPSDSAAEGGGEGQA